MSSYGAVFKNDTGRLVITEGAYSFFENANEPEVVGLKHRIESAWGGWRGNNSSKDHQGYCNVLEVTVRVRHTTTAEDLDALPRPILFVRADSLLRWSDWNSRGISWGDFEGQGAYTAWWPMGEEGEGRVSSSFTILSSSEPVWEHRPQQQQWSDDSGNIYSARLGTYYVDYVVSASNNFPRLGNDYYSKADNGAELARALRFSSAVPLASGDVDRSQTHGMEFFNSEGRLTFSTRPLNKCATSQMMKLAVIDRPDYPAYPGIRDHMTPTSRENLIPGDLRSLIPHVQPWMSCTSNSLLGAKSPERMYRYECDSDNSPVGGSSWCKYYFDSRWGRYYGGVNLRLGPSRRSYYASGVVKNLSLATRKVRNESRSLISIGSFQFLVLQSGVRTSESGTAGTVAHEGEDRVMIASNMFDVQSRIPNDFLEREFG